MNRCLNDIFGYCYNKPHPTRVKYQKSTFDYRGHIHLVTITVTRCINNHQTCAHYLTHIQLQALKTEYHQGREPN